MLNAREPQIINGPQILDKYVGESEAKVRRLFEPAEEEEKRVRNIIDKASFLNSVLYIFTKLTLRQLIVTNQSLNLVGNFILLYEIVVSQH